MRVEKAAWIVVLVLLALFLVKSAQMSACTCGWGYQTVIHSSGAGGSHVLAAIDTFGTRHVVWHDASGPAVLYRFQGPDSVWGHWSPVDTIAYTSWTVFGAAADSSGNLHVVWADTSEIGPRGETSNLYYKWVTPYSGCGATCNITPTYNVPGDEEHLAEDFESVDVDSIPAGWCSEGSQSSSETGPWGKWAVDGCLGRSSTHGILGSRLDSFPSIKDWYLVMPPILIHEDSTASFSFWYRLDQEGSAGLRLRGVEGFALKSHLPFTRRADSLRFVLWEDTLITHTEYESVGVAIDDSLKGKFLFIAFDLFKTSSTSVGVCIDDICTDVEERCRPTMPRELAHCAAPSVAVDNHGNIHVAFERIVWQPEACMCREQVYYLRYDSGSTEWCSPVHVDSSGIGDRDYAIARLYRKGSDAAIAVDRTRNVYIAWTDVGPMNYGAYGDDVFFNWRQGDAATPSWQGRVILSDDGDGQGVLDEWWCLKPDLAVDNVGERVMAVFHGSRDTQYPPPPDSGRGVPDDSMRVWCRIRDNMGQWPDECMIVPDPDTSETRNTPDCRCPSVDVDSYGNIYVAYTWSDTLDTGEPEALAVAKHCGRDSAWVWPARIIQDLRDDVTVERSPCIKAERFLFWCENAVNEEWGSVRAEREILPVLDDPPNVAMFVDEFTRGLCPSGDDELDADEKTAFEIRLTIKDNEGIPLAGFPPDSLYVTVVGDTASPSDTCALLDPVGFTRVDSTYRFWCVSSDTLFATDTTGVNGTLITVKNVSGKARLRLQAHYGSSATGSQDTVWINSVDQVPSVPDGKVWGPDFASFSAAYNAWRFDTLGNWAWDLLHEEGDTCRVGGEVRPVFDVDAQDYSWFGAHYTDTLEANACDD